MLYEICNSGTVVATVPDRPLAKWAVEISPKEKKKFADWSDQDHRDTYKILRQVTATWEKNDIVNFSVLGVDRPDQAFSWQVVPYPSKGKKIVQLLSFLWRVVFGAPTLSVEQKNQYQIDYQNWKKLLDPKKEKGKTSSNCVFCNESRQKSHRVFSDEQSSIWYNRAPLVYRHFMVIPNDHVPSFVEMQEKDYCDWMDKTKKIDTDLYEKQQKRVISYYYWKDGERAGQTVPHVHLHVYRIIAIWEMISAVLYSFFGTLFSISFSLSDQELEKRVEFFKPKFNPILN